MAGITLSPQEQDIFKIVFAIRQLTEGRSNATGSVTLTAGGTTTAVTAPTCAAGSAVFLFPKTANAAAALTTTYVLVANVSNGQFTITHTNNGQTDRTFWWVALG